MVFPLKRIKDINIQLDEEIGEATVTIVLHGKRRDEIKTTIAVNDVIPLVEAEGTKIIDTIKNDRISNRYGEATGVWVFKIPTIDPENSTTTILKRRERKKIIEEEFEEDWNLGPEE